MVADNTEPVKRNKKEDDKSDVKPKEAGSTAKKPIRTEAEIERYKFWLEFTTIFSGFVCLYGAFQFQGYLHEKDNWPNPGTEGLEGPCNIPRINAQKVSQKEFLRKYAYDAPVVIEGGNENWRFKGMSRRDRMLADWGDTVVKLSSANTHSYGTKDVTLREYIETMIKPQDPNAPANETFYWFGYNDMEEWKEFFDEYKLPPYELPRHSPALSFGLAGPGSGVPFHFHGPGFAETLHGRKRWFLTPHHVQPEFNPNKTTMQWWIEDYKRIAKEIDLYECTLSPGEIIYFPDRWWHATLNLDTTVFISTFLSP